MNYLFYLKFTGKAIYHLNIILKYINKTKMLKFNCYPDITIQIIVGIFYNIMI